MNMQHVDFLRVRLRLMRQLRHARIHHRPKARYAVRRALKLVCRLYQECQGEEQ